MKVNYRDRILYIFALVMLFSLTLGVFAEDNSNVNVLPHLIKASSYLSQNDLRVIANYHPYYLIDNDPNTAWVEGASGSGIKETVLMWVAIPQNATIKIAIRNGFQKTGELFYKNNRVKELEVTFMLGNLYDAEYLSKIYTLEDITGWQIIEFKSEKECRYIAFTIHSVYRGTTYDDTCISDINISIDNDLGINTTLQKEIRNEYNLWFKERTEKSRFFKNLPADYPFKQYEKMIYEKKITWEEFDLYFQNDESYLSLFAEVYTNTELTEFLASDYGKSYLNILTSKFVETESGNNFEYTGTKMFRPEILSEYIFRGVEEYLKFSNIKLNNSKDNDANKIWHIYEKNSHIKRMILEDCYEYEDGLRYDTVDFYYDSKGRLIFKKYKFLPHDGELCDNLMLVWQGDVIDKIFYFYSEEDDDGAKTKMVINK